MTTLRVGAAQLTQVGYAEIDLPPETFGLTGDPVRAAAAVWIIESGDARIAVDPALAADDILRNDHDAATHQEAIAALLSDAGFARETITHAVATPLDGIGMLGWREDDGTWTKFFPNASLLYSRRELEAIDAGEHPAPATLLGHLRAAGAVEPVADGHAITDEVTLEHTGCHTPGHQVVRITSEGESAVIVGHLAVVPLHLTSGPIERQHVDAQAAWAALCAIRDQGDVMIGPLWPAPGAGRWDGAQLVPV
jgi:glyoxylase-like metal-dependent hydrolase (beta-lactamase superfamily II)